MWSQLESNLGLPNKGQQKYCLVYRLIKHTLLQVCRVMLRYVEIVEHTCKVVGEMSHLEPLKVIMEKKNVAQ